jgi:gamma-glutamyltranspeptidase/glutathione hydrolase
MVVAGHYLASQAGFAVLEAGGNAIDAGVAAGLVLGVVQSDIVNIAGVAPIILYAVDTREIHTISGVGGWPAALSPDLFQVRHAGRIPLGLLRTVVPAAPDAWTQALTRWGTMTFAEVSQAAIRLARDGFVMHPLMAEVIALFKDNYAAWPSSAAIYLTRGEVPKVGDLFIQADLAATLQHMTDEEKASARGRHKNRAWLGTRSRMRLNSRWRHCRLPHRRHYAITSDAGQKGLVTRKWTG